MARNGNQKTGQQAGAKHAGRLGPRGKLGTSGGLSVDPAAAAFPATLLSAPGYPRLHSFDGSPILVGVMAKSAVFWDRDNTLIEDPGYISDPQQVRLLPGAAQSVKRLAEAGFENIIITNQSGIARGLLDEPTLERIHDRLRELLAAEGAEIDAIYFCPYLDGPDAVVEKYRQDSDLRKPKPGMLAQASLERKIELAGSWVVGNSLSDTQAGRAAGCRTILVGNGDAGRDRSVDFTAASLDAAVDIILRNSVPAKADAPPSDSRGSGNMAKVNKTLEEILAFMRTVDRRNQAEDFSLSRMVGLVMQMLALAALVWAAFGMIRAEEYGAQIVKLLFAIALQALALTCFVLSSRR